MKIGVLALQGDFEMHLKAMKALKCKAVPVRKVDEIESCDGLIIPGGESTTFMNLINRMNLLPVLKKFGKEKVIFGTCAGSIIVASAAENEKRFDTLNLIDVTVRRNAYGRQVDSFIDHVKLDERVFGSQKPFFEGVFIRAPKFIQIGRDVKPLAWHHDDVVLAENKNILIGTFHPELTNDYRIHDYFLKKIAEFNDMKKAG